MSGTAVAPTSPTGVQGAQVSIQGSAAPAVNPAGSSIPAIAASHPGFIRDSPSGDLRSVVSNTAPIEAVVSGAFAVDWSASYRYVLTLVGNTVLSFEPPPALTNVLLLTVINTGAFTLTFPASCRTPGGGATAANQTANGTDRYVFNYDNDGTLYDWQSAKNFLL